MYNQKYKKFKKLKLILSKMYPKEKQLFNIKHYNPSILYKGKKNLNLNPKNPSTYQKIIYLKKKYSLKRAPTKV